MLKPEYVAPLVAALCSENPPASGQLYEAGSGWFAATRWQRARGVDFELEKGIPPAEDVAKVCDNYFSNYIAIKSYWNGSSHPPRRSQRSAISTTAKLTTRKLLRRVASTLWAM
jgi:hypothetical protein